MYNSLCYLKRNKLFLVNRTSYSIIIYNSSYDRLKKWLQDKVCISSEQAIDVIIEEFNSKLHAHNNYHHKMIYQNCVIGINQNDIKTQQVNNIIL